MLADGAIRSGKTVSMILSFLLWSLSTFHDRDFIVAGVTAGAFERAAAVCTRAVSPVLWAEAVLSLRPLFSAREIR